MRVSALRKRVLIYVVSCWVALAMSPVRLQTSAYAMAALGGQSAPLPEQPVPSRLTPQQLQELVAPIALYPDALLAQILAASAYPTQIVEADRFLQQNPDLKGKDLGAAVDQQDWDPSVKALTQFPSVLANMDKDLSWTSELGDANYNQPQDVMDAIQYMRGQARNAGKLQSTPQQTVTTQGSTVVIEPANPQVVYVPTYDPALVYGYPVPLWPGFYPWWGVGGPFISFGIGFDIFPFFGFGWGWGAWGFHWGLGGGLFFGGARYAFHSHAFYDRSSYFHGNFRGYAPYNRGDRALRGYASRGERSFAPEARSGGGARDFGARSAPSLQSGERSDAFGGYSRGGDERSFSSRGQSSMGEGGFRGGGMRGGGRR